MIVTEPPDCTCANPSIIPICRVVCDEGQFADECPSCSTLCTPPNELCGDIVCQQTVANWACRKPSSCPQPICELVCESPPQQCEYSGLLDPWKKNDDFSWGIFFAVLAALFVLSINVVRKS